jgi:SAM-dependent methyltransferase
VQTGARDSLSDTAVSGESSPHVVVAPLVSGRHAASRRSGGAHIAGAAPRLVLAAAPFCAARGQVRPAPSGHYVREKYRRLAANYDRRVRWSERLRRRVFPEFDLRAGDVVLDVGCGTGLSFPFLEEAIGPSGRLVGIEQSPEMLAVAEERVEAAAWQNVTLIEASAEAADIPVAVDALVFFVTHDIVRSQAALENVFGPPSPERGYSSWERNRRRGGPHP